jgi:hypothetical protein
MKLKLFTIAIALYVSMDAQTKDSTTKTEERPFQLTFITPLGTNGIDAPKITNRFSLNIIGGVARGLEGFEAGSVANVILKDVKGVQMVGVGNIVLGNLKGAQFAGYVNYVGGDIHGAGFAGFCNISLGKCVGGQVAGFHNFNRKGVKGVQIAGHSNVTLGNVNGVQASAFANVAVGDVKGAQLCGFVNYAKKVHGVQAGIINISDTIDGYCIGLLNIVKKGIHQVEVSADETFYANLNYRTGCEKFYNIFSAGIKPGMNLWHFGYGAGTTYKIMGKYKTDLNITAHHVNYGAFSWTTSELFRFYWGVERRKPGKKIALAFGPTLNVYISDTYDPDYDNIYKSVAPYGGGGYTSSYGFNTKVWIGARLAVRFL